MIHETPATTPTITFRSNIEATLLVYEAEFVPDAHALVPCELSTQRVLSLPEKRGGLFRLERIGRRSNKAYTVYPVLHTATWLCDGSPHSS